MAIQKSESIVLRRQDLRETSLILTFYTRDFGKIKGILRGARGPRAQCPGASFEIFALDGIVFYERKSSDIYTISQCDLIEYFAPIRGSLEKLTHATYIIELLDSVTSLGDTNSGVFDLLVNSLRLMSGDASARRVSRIFEIKLLALLGIMPSLGECANCGSRLLSGARFSLRHGGLICKACFAADAAAFSISPGTINFIEHIRSSSFEKASKIKVSQDLGRELERTLRRFLDFHIERRLKTVRFLKEIETALKV